MIQPTRVRALNREPPRKRDFVLYWMQASQRAEWNHALEYTFQEANRLRRPALVYFGLTDRYPEANARHYTFMLEGLQETARALKRRGAALILRRENPAEGVVRAAVRACLVVTDRGYTRIQREWRRAAADGLDCPLIQVESDVVVPVEEASAKAEYSAATFRPRILRRLPDYLVGVRPTSLIFDSLGGEWTGRFEEDSPGPEDPLEREGRVFPVSAFHPGGAGEARRRLQKFLAAKIKDYADLSRDPSRDGISGLSPYLHFGQISSLEVAKAVGEARDPGSRAFLEELIVRRELSMNYVFYTSAYDRYDALPEWCRRTLAEHAADERPYRYDPAELESAATHDPYWNAAQLEMVRTGKMHGYMRMYWGKKILEWTKDPKAAFRVALALNNRWELDGRDPNGFAGVAWCFGKHDRAWGERPVFGKVRSMTASGLERKFPVAEYVRRVEKL